MPHESSVRPRFIICSASEVRVSIHDFADPKVCLPRVLGNDFLSSEKEKKKKKTLRVEVFLPLATSTHLPYLTE